MGPPYLLAAPRYGKAAGGAATRFQKKAPPGRRGFREVDAINFRRRSMNREPSIEAIW